MDDTTSISIAEFDEQLHFLVNLMKNIEISDDGIRVAMVTYGDNGFMVFSLEQYNNSAEPQLQILPEATLLTDVHTDMQIAR